MGVATTNRDVEMCVTGPCSRCDDAVQGLLMLQNFVPTKRMLGLGEDARVKIVLEVNEERLAACTLLRGVADEFAARVGETGALEHAICAVEWLLTCMTGPQKLGWDFIRSIVSQDTFVAVCFCSFVGSVCV